MKITSDRSQAWILLLPILVYAIAIGIIVMSIVVSYRGLVQPNGVYVQVRSALLLFASAGLVITILFAVWFYKCLRLIQKEDEEAKGKEYAEWLEYYSNRNSWRR